MPLFAGQVATLTQKVPLLSTVLALLARTHVKPDLAHQGNLERGIWITLLLSYALGFAWAYSAGIRFTDWAPFWRFNAIFGVVWLIYGFLGRSRRIGDMAQQAAIWKSMGASGVMISYCALALPFPLYDDLFVRLDAAFGFHWKVWFDFVHSHEWLEWTFAKAYNSLTLQICFAFMYFAHFGLPERNRELVWISIVSGTITSLIAGIFPALGAFHHFDVVDKARHLPDLMVLRTHGLDSFAIEKVEGLVTLPSYHAAMAIYFVYVFRRQGLVFWAMAALNSVMLIATLSHGGHYLVDVLAGVLVVYVSIVIVHRYRHRLGTDLDSRPRAPQGAGT